MTKKKKNKKKINGQHDTTTLSRPQQRPVGGRNRLDTCDAGESAWEKGRTMSWEGVRGWL